MIKLRTFQQSDVEKLDKLWQEHWSDHSLPNRTNAIIDAIAENDEERIIGYGQVKLFAEAMLFLDPSARKRDRVQALKRLMLEAFRGADINGIEEIYAFIQDPAFAVLIEKRYGFSRIVSPGELLLRKL